MKAKALLTIGVLFGALFLASCGTTQPYPGMTPPPAEQQILDLDPRTGSSQTVTNAVRKRFDTALRDLRSGERGAAEKRLIVLQRKNPTYHAIDVALAAIAIHEGDLKAAETLLNAVLAKEPEYLAANAYSAEIALRRDDLAGAHDILRKLNASPDAPPAIRNAFETARRGYFDSLFNEANATSDLDQSIALLRQSLSIIPEAEAARVLLVRKLIDLRRFDDARRQLEPLVQAKPDGEEVESALAEIDAGKGRYQEAIARFDRLARINPSRYGPRLTEIKQKWIEANLPSQYHNALSSEAVSRADLSVLMYWKVAAVRFPRALSQPPIAIDIGGVQGRDEFVRALALRLYLVDPVTRTAGPDRLVSAGSFLRLAERLLSLRGTPQCARGATGESELSRAVNALAACGVKAGPLASDSERPVRGREAAAILEAIDRAIESAEQRQARKADAPPQQPSQVGLPGLLSGFGLERGIDG
jgi:tetratricopeptide (TPR) repeat protein